MTVINYEIKDLQSFKSRLHSVELLIKYGKKYFNPLGYKGGEIDRVTAEKCYLLNRRKDDRVRGLHRFVEHFCDFPTYLSTDVLFETILKIMDLLNKSTLNIGDIGMINDKIEYFYQIYSQSYEIMEEKE